LKRFKKKTKGFGNVTPLSFIITWLVKKSRLWQLEYRFPEDTIEQLPLEDNNPETQIPEIRKPYTKIPMDVRRHLEETRDERDKMGDAFLRFLSNLDESDLARSFNKTG